MYKILNIATGVISCVMLFVISLGIKSFKNFIFYYALFGFVVNLLNIFFVILNTILVSNDNQNNNVILSYQYIERKNIFFLTRIIFVLCTLPIIILY